MQEDAQHAPQRLGSTPQQLVANSECGQVFRPHRQLAQSSDRHRQGSGHRRWGEFFHGDIPLIRNHFDPIIVGGEHGIDFIQRHVLFELDG